jgi:NTE family protein
MVMHPSDDLASVPPPALVKILEASPFFRELPEYWVDLLSRSAERTPFAAGQLIESAGNVADRLYVVASGRVEVFCGETEEEREVIGSAMPGAVLGRGPLTNEPELASCRAATDVETWSWDRRRLDFLRQAAPGLDDQLHCRVSILGRQRELLRLLGRSTLFGSISPALLRRLLEATTLAKFAAGECICKEGEEGEYLFLIVQGEVEVVRTIPERTAPVVVAVLRSGDCFGEIALLEHAARNATVITMRDSELLLIAKRDFDTLCRSSASFRRGNRAVADERIRIAQPTETPEPVWLVNRSALASTRLMAFLSQALNSTGARVLVLEVGDSSRRPGQTVSRMPGIELETVHPDSLTADAVVRRGFDYVLCYGVDAGTAAPAALQELSPTILAIAENATRALPDEIDPGQVVHDVQLVDSTSAHAVPRGHAQRGTMRAAIPFSAFEDARDFRDLPDTPRSFFLRLARMLARQRVGVALGGGGAWGWAHCALLRGLHRAGIPIDVVAGASFGSVVGAFYASEGLAGLDRLVAAMPQLARAFLPSPITTIPLGRFLARHLPTGRLEELGVLFMPVAVDIRTGTEKVFRSGPIGAAVRASCSFPGLIAPTMSGKVRYVDACVKSNVPAGCLLEEGIDFVVASSVVPPPSVMPSSSRETTVGRILAHFSPLARVRDAIRSMQLMLNDTGSRHSSLAAVTFAPNLAEFAITEIRRGHEVIERAEAQLPRFLDEVSDSYRAFCSANLHHTL